VLNSEVHGFFEYRGTIYLWPLYCMNICCGYCSSVICKDADLLWRCLLRGSPHPIILNTSDILFCEILAKSKWKRTSRNKKPIFRKSAYSEKKTKWNGTKWHTAVVTTQNLKWNEKRKIGVAVGPSAEFVSMSGAGCRSQHEMACSVLLPTGQILDDLLSCSQDRD
jgi:hypothetical protein